MKMLIIAIMFLAGAAVADIIPMSQWPRVIYLPGKQVVNPSVAQCVEAGYRLLPAKPATPEGKEIASEQIVQDSKNPTRAVYQITYADKVAVVVTNVSADKVVFQFSATGAYLGLTWTDAPKTNAVVEK
jgi:hypothetical protein